jgi:hypothetical protein
MNDLYGVSCSCANESGTLILLTLRPGADPKRVAEEANRALRGQARDRVGVILQGDSAAAALRGEQWRSPDQVAETLTAGTRLPRSRAAMFLLFWALLLACLTDGLLIAWLLRRERGLAQAGRAHGGMANSAKQPARAA